jgi:hypothetical protein
MPETTKKIKKVSAEPTKTVVPSVDDLEEKRRLFQQSVAGKPPIKSKSKSAPKPAAKVNHAKAVHAIKKHPSNKKRTFMIAGFAVALLLVSGVSVYAYHFWQQTPDKIVFDALRNAAGAETITVKGTATDSPKASFDVMSKGSALAVNGKMTTDLAGKQTQLNGSFVRIDNALYAKVDRLTDIFIEKLAPAGIDKFKPYIQPFAANIDSSWIKMNNDSMPISSDNIIGAQCAVDFFQKIRTDKSAANELFAAYLLHPFFTVTEQSRISDTTAVYRLVADSTKATAFQENLKSTSFYRSLSKCAGNALAFADLSNVMIDMTVNTTTRTMSDISVSQGSTLVASMTTSFEKPVTIAAPAESVEFSDLQNQVTSLYLLDKK